MPLISYHSTHLQNHLVIGIFDVTLQVASRREHRMVGITRDVGPMRWMIHTLLSTFVPEGWHRINPCPQGGVQNWDCDMCQ